MRCLACNVILNEDEQQIKYDGHDEYIELCEDCISKTDFIGDLEDL